MKLTDRGRLAAGDDNVVTTFRHLSGRPAAPYVDQRMTEGARRAGPPVRRDDLVRLSLTRNPAPCTIRQES
jgi:hypothetical protein